MSYDWVGSPAYLSAASNTSPFHSETLKNVCECVKGDSETEGGTGSRLGCRVDGWDLQDRSGIKGHSFLTGVCGVRGLARASQSFQQDLIRAEWAPLKAGIVFYQRSLFHEPCGDTEGP